MKRILALMLIIVLAFGLAGCTRGMDANVDSKQAAETDRIMEEANNQIGLPNINNFYEKKTLKEIYELRDDSSLVTYTYTTALDGKKIFLFQSIGYGLPMSVQYSNPSVYKGVVTPSLWSDIDKYSYSYEIMPQAEPNGLFMPEGLSATWVMRIKEDGNREPVYVEEEITVTQTKLPRRLCAEWSLPDDY